VVFAVFVIVFCFCGCTQVDTTIPACALRGIGGIEIDGFDFVEMIRGEEAVRVEISLLSLNGMKLFGYEKGRVLPNYDGEPVIADVYVLKDCEGEESCSYLVVEGNFGLIIKDITPEGISSMWDELYVCNIDSDAQDEIIVHQLVGSAGGAGSYKARIFKVIGNEIEELYCFDNENMLYTGFFGRLKNGYVVEIRNSFTGKKHKLDMSGEERYEGVLFDADGKVIKNSGWGVMCDSFCEFSPNDIDGDGIYEIVCKQYVSLYSHSDGLGLAESVLRFDEGSQSFEVIDSDFHAWDD